jgi:hypothetical protein
LLALHLGVISPLLAASPFSRSIEDYEASRDWILEVAGHPVAASRVYYSAYDVSWLVEAPALGMVLIRPRSGAVFRVTREGEARPTLSATSAVRLEPEEVRSSLAVLHRDGEAYDFVVEELAVRLVPAPPLLGPQTRRKLEERHPSMVGQRSAYAESREMQGAESLVSQWGAPTLEELTVRVYFGSWSSASLRLAPRIAAIEEAWRSSGLRFEYYGLPQPLIDDAQAAADGVLGVPTVVVKHRDRELGRLTGRALDDPLDHLSRILGGNGD